MERSRLRNARKAMAMSQEEVAEAIGVDDDTVSKWELGKATPHPEHARMLAKLFDKPLEELDLCCDESAMQQSELIATLEKSATAALDVRLMTIVIRWPTYRCGCVDLVTLETLIGQELERRPAMTNQESDLSRRQALLLLAQLPVSAFGLSALVATPKLAAEEVLSLCAAGMRACWQLSRGTDLWEAFIAVSAYLPTLTLLTRQARHRKSAALLAAQGYSLKATLGWHLEGLNEAKSYALEAKKYSEISENVILRLDALHRLATVYHYAEQHATALTTIQEAQNIIEHESVPVIVAREIYLDLSVHLAYNHRPTESQAAYTRARSLYDVESDDPLASMMLGYGGYGLILWGGVSLTKRGLYKDAMDLFELAVDPNNPTIARMPTCSERSRVEIVNNFATTTLKMPQKDIDLTLRLLEAGGQGAIGLQSERRYQENVSGFNIAEGIWSGEPRIMEARARVQHWK